VGNLYYAQPLLDLIAGDLHTGQGTAGLMVTATQVGYALGIMFIVPLGDVRNRRRMVPLMMALSALSLACCAAAPGIVLLLCALLAVGLSTVAGQILIPLTGDLADERSRGRVLGIVVSGALTGILVARIISGFIAHAAGWRVVFLCAAALMLGLSVLLWRAMPVTPPKSSRSYRSLLRSVPRLVRREPVLRLAMVYGVICMATFTIFWTGLTFLLSAPPYRYSTAVIGLFSLAGLVGSMAAQGAGRLHDRGWSTRATGLFWLLAVAAWAICGLGRYSLAWLLIGIVVLDVATQGQRILNQAQIFAISAEARSRINTAYVTGNFVGGAAGSITASALWAFGGWLGVSIAGAGLSLIGFAVWAVSQLRRSRTA
jgi:predicted MFS family arabinose efflux permease